MLLDFGGDTTTDSNQDAIYPFVVSVLAWETQTASESKADSWKPILKMHI